ncbi:MAG: class II fructose-bisphosphate aldolase [Firmicutes bacterium]|nr:class II fructose-bisphosphate aldolase [Bacillota bacterium]
MSLLSGKQVRKVFGHFSPFQESGELKPETERVSILAANAQVPLDVMSRAFTTAASDGSGSPLLVQMSFTALKAAGGGDPASGAALARAILEAHAEQSGARLVGMTLDHFRVPAFPARARGVGAAAPREGGDGRQRRLDERLARARIDDAAAAASGLPGCAVDRETVEQYIGYMTSAQYAEFKRSFLEAVRCGKPAWGMIDTERLPPVLDFAVTRDVIDAVRQCPGNDDIVLEAEFGATGSSGDAIPYVRLVGRELEEFARSVAAFVAYTGADAIAYPIGMEHAARRGETHEPDIERLVAVHREVARATGRYVPFAQHGGTGAARLARGLVGKNNVATKFVVVAANYLADYVRANEGDIRAGVKSACGARMFDGMVRALVEVTIGKLKECGSYGRAPELTFVLAEEARAPSYKGTGDSEEGVE